MNERRDGPPTCKHFSNPAGLQVNCGDGSPEGLDKANHSQGWLLHQWGEYAFKQGDLIVSALDDGVIEEGVVVMIACGEDDKVNSLKHGPILKHGRGLRELLHTGLDGHVTSQDARWQLIIEHRLFPQGAVQKRRDKAFAVKCFIFPKYLQQPMALKPHLSG